MSWGWCSVLKERRWRIPGKMLGQELAHAGVVTLVFFLVLFSCAAS